MDTSPFDFLVFIIFIIIYLSVFLLFIFRVAFHFVFIIKLPCVFLLFSVFPDTLLLFPLVALSMCYLVVPRYYPYNVFLRLGVPLPLQLPDRTQGPPRAPRFTPGLS
jgi:hypothetical protein